MVESKTYDLDLIFQALSDPTRRMILNTIARRERTIGEVADPFSMSLAAVSKHVKVLERAQLIQRERRGKFIYLRLNGDALASADTWIAYYRHYWQDRLSALKDFIEEESV